MKFDTRITIYNIIRNRILELVKSKEFKSRSETGILFVKVKCFRHKNAIGRVLSRAGQKAALNLWYVYQAKFAKTVHEGLSYLAHQVFKKAYA